MNFFEFIAEEVRELLAELGFRTLDEAIGRAEVLDIDRRRSTTGRPPGSTSRPILARARAARGRQPATRSPTQDHGLDQALDHELIELAEPALERRRAGRSSSCRSAT